MFELLVAVSITAIILIGLMSLSTISVRNTSTSTDTSAANRFAQEAVEFIRNERDSTPIWADFVTQRSDHTYCFNDTPPQSPVWNEGACNDTEIISGTNLKRDVTLTTRDPDTVDIAVTVSWDTTQGEKFVTVSSTLTNWRK